MYLLMVFPISIGQCLTAIYILLESRVNDKLLSDGVASKLPGKQVLVSGLRIRISSIDDMVVILFKLSVIVLDSVCYTNIACHGAGCGAGCGACKETSGDYQWRKGSSIEDNSRTKCS